MGSYVFFICGVILNTALHGLVIIIEQIIVYIIKDFDLEQFVYQDAVCDF